MMRVVIIGAGQAGLGLAVPLLDQGHAVVLAGTPRDEPVIELLQDGGAHPALGRPAPAALGCRSYLELDALLRAGPDLVVVAVRRAGLGGVAEHLRRASSGLPVLVVGGGLVAERGELLTPAAWLGRALTNTGVTVGSLGGPWRPVDLLERQDVVALLSLPAGIRARRLERALSGAVFHLRLASDDVGTPAAAALASLFAVGLRRAGGAGAAAAGGTVAAVVAQAVLETGRLLNLLGASAEPAIGPAGLGRLIRLMTPHSAGDGADPEMLEASGRELALEIGPTVVGWCATGRTARDAIPLTRSLLDALLDDTPLILPWSRFQRPA